MEPALKPLCRTRSNQVEQEPVEEALDTLLVLLTRAPANARMVAEAERHCRALFVDYLRTCGVVGRQVRVAARARLLTTQQCGMLLCSGPAHAQRGGARDGLSLRTTLE